MFRNSLHLKAIKLIATLFLGLVFSHSLAFGNCHDVRMTTQSSALLYTQPGGASLGLRYTSNTELRIDRLNGHWAQVTWSNGSGWVRTNNFPPSQVRRARSACHTPHISENRNIELAPDGSIVRPNSSLVRSELIIATQDNYECLPPVVKEKLNEMVGMGWRVNLMSAYRSRRDNARRNGARDSLHIQCRAADFTVTNVSRREVENYLLGSWSGGLGLYCTGRFHIDNGNHRIWGSCLTGEKRRLYYSRSRRTMPGDRRSEARHRSHR